MALPLLGIVTSLTPVIGQLIDKIFPDKNLAEAKKLEAQIALAQMEQNGDLETLKTSLSAILAEASSTDPWTSRARPSFMYVMYVMILSAIPMGVIHAFNSSLAESLTDGVQSWLLAIPEPLWWLFGAGYLGYSGVRSFDKWRGTAK